MKVPIVYSDAYDLNLGEHIFPAIKYRLIRDRLLEDGVVTEKDLLQPEAASDDQIRLVHSDDWVRKLKTGTLSYQEIIKLEVPYSSQLVRAFWQSAGGTVRTSRLALEHGIAYNLGGGFHHAFRGHGEGFCAINDVAVGIRVLQEENLIERAMVVDCDVHHGNGTADIFAEDDTVFTFSIHQFANYPTEKPPSNLDIHLDDGVGDQEFLDKLKRALVPAIELFRPEMIVYVAGADPYANDQLGGLNLSLEGLMARDRLVLTQALRQNVPVAITLAGGYAYDVADTVAIHANTYKAANVVLGEMGWKTDLRSKSLD
jgi:acetoin utilization deacetylase AcuC-like enzyme